MNFNTNEIVAQGAATPRHAFTFRFRTLIIGLLMILGLGWAGADLAAQPTASISLSPAAATGTEVTSVDLFAGQPQWEGFYGVATLDLGSQTLAYTLYGGNGDPLPANTDLAMLTLIDPDGGPDRLFLVRAGGGGTMIVLDDY